MPLFKPFSGSMAPTTTTQGDHMAQPTFIVYTVTEYTVGTEKRSKWRECGAAFQHKDGEGLDVILDALPVNGRLTLRKPKEKEDAGESAA